MSTDDSTVVQRVNPLVRWFVIGLPLGLLIMGTLSFAVFFQKRHAREMAAAAPSRYAAMLRKDLNLADYRRYHRIFEQEIGPRTTDKSENIEAAQSFIESTLGFGNMGYQVMRREFGLDGMKKVHLEVEIKGAESPDTLVLVVAPYDDSCDENISALLVMAQAFTGTRHRNTIRFIALFRGPNEPEQNGRKMAPEGIEFYRSLVPTLLNPSAVTVWMISNKGPNHMTHGIRGEQVGIGAPSIDDPEALRVLQDGQKMIEKLANKQHIK